MSSNGGSGGQPEKAALKHLEKAVGGLLTQLATWKERAMEAEGKSAELEELIRRFTDDDAAAGRLLTSLHELEAENADLTKRLAKGRAGVDRMLARIRFLEEKR